MLKWDGDWVYSTGKLATKLTGCKSFGLFFFWSEVENHLKSKSFKNKVELFEKIKECVKGIPLKMIQDLIDNFRSRISAVEKYQGGLILNKNF